MSRAGRRTKTSIPICHRVGSIGLADDFVVLTVSTYPKPENAVADLGTESSIVSPNSYRPEITNAFEV
jgi:hypothetical protein